ncbi:MAG: SBBP repeat-containing protein [Candidatus Aminicenantales bacterium]
MRKTLFVLFIGILLCAGMTVSPVAPHPGSSSPRTFPPGRPAQVPDLKPQPTGNPSGLHLDFGSLPLYFTANRGQVDGRALFYAKAARYTLWLTEKGLVFDSFKSERAEAPAAGKEPSLRPEKREDRRYERDVSRLVFLNAAKHPEIVPVDETALKVNYFIGNDPAKWHTAVPTSGAVLYRNIYDRIDLKVYGIESRIEYDWIVRPGGNPRDIRFEYRNMKGTRVDEAGNLLVETGFGELVHKKPAAYQEAGAKLSVEGRSGNGTRVAVESAFKMIGENAYGFEVGAYDAGLELVIDPVVLAYSTYLGGNSDDYGQGIAVDGSGNAYVTGYTLSTNFPTLNQYQTDKANTDVFVTKIDTTKSGNDSLVYSTYLGGSSQDYGYGIAVDGSGNAYVTGYTSSTDFPTLNQYQTDPGDGNYDVFVTKIDTTKSGNDSLVYSTYLGGSGTDYGYGIAVDGSGNAYVTGWTQSTNFPTLNQYQTDQASTDAFVTKIDTTKSGNDSLVYSTYLGGSGTDYGEGIAVDGSGNAYVTGWTQSTNFPTLNQYQTDQTGWDVFIAKISADIPTVTTTAVSDIAFSTATSGGNVTAEGGAAVTARGVCWSTSANPTTADSKTTDGSGSGGFTSSITGLTSSTTYHVRAYATNAAGTSYGDDLTFGTSASTFTISGKMTDGPNPVQNVTVTFSHDGHTESTAANGTYSYTVPRGTTTTVTPSHAAYPSWTPASRTITNITADQPNQDFQGTPIMYRISGTVTDGTNPVGGVTITFSFYGHTETTAADGTYSYNVPPYSSTIITPSKTGYGSWIPAVRELAHITSDEPNQDFQGTNLTAPRMTLVQGQTTIPKGGTYDYGTQMVNLGSQAVFTINNTGHSDLTLQTNLVINGANADQFSVIQAPTSPVAPNQSTTFIIEFKATSVGQKTASISLLNNDPANNPYDLNLQGKGETSLAFVYSGSWTGAGKAGAGWFIGDFNGDGKKDIFRYYPGVSGADMFLSDGTKFNSVGTWTGAGYGSNGWYVGDFNGDGKADIFRYLPGISGADMFLSDGTQFNSVGSWTGAGYGSDGWYVGDFNGDGKDDIFRYLPGISGADMFLSDGTQFVSVGSWTGAGNGSDGWYVGDFNGDGKCDIFRYVPGVGSEVFLSDGMQFVSAGIWTLETNGTDGWYVGDFNGDGKDDIMRYTPGVGSEVFLSDGMQFVSAGIWTGAGNGADGWYVGDFNGDGNDDIFRYLPGVSGADVFLAGSVSGPVSEFDAFQRNVSSSVGILLDAAYWMEEKWLEPFRQKAARGELVSLMDLKQAYENATGEKPTRAVFLRWLKKHDFQLISKE